MSIKILPYSEYHINFVKQFNLRLKTKGIKYQFPESNIPAWLPKTEGISVYQEFFVAQDIDSVRGASIIKYQDFSFKGEILKAGCLQLPLSEGIINPTFSSVGLQLIFDALEKEPSLFALGIGSYEESYSKLLLRLRWEDFPVPFYFKIIYPFNFFRKLTYLRNKNSFYKIFLDLSALLVFPGILIKIYQALRSDKSFNTRFELFNEFERWADDIWERNYKNYSMTAVRNSTILNHLYGKDKKRFIKIKVFNSDKIIGWAVLLVTRFKNHRQFGDMLGGTIVDNFAETGAEISIINAAEFYFKKEAKVDLILTNQSNKNWCDAFRRKGFLKGPSNYIFFCSKSLSEKLNPLHSSKDFTHFNRGDGDGPINL